MDLELACESRIVGKFRGWERDKIYKLEDGSKWEQVGLLFKYRFWYQPKAKVWRDESKYYLDVEGMDEQVEVRPWPTLPD
jgi:hypothetical protein